MKTDWGYLSLATAAPSQVLTPSVRAGPWEAPARPAASWAPARVEAGRSPAYQKNHRPFTAQGTKAEASRTSCRWQRLREAKGQPGDTQQGTQALHRERAEAPGLSEIPWQNGEEQCGATAGDPEPLCCSPAWGSALALARPPPLWNEHMGTEGSSNSRPWVIFNSALWGWGSPSAGRHTRPTEPSLHTPRSSPRSKALVEGRPSASAPGGSLQGYHREKGDHGLGTERSLPSQPSHCPAVTDDQVGNKEALRAVPRGSPTPGPSGGQAHSKPSLRFLSDQGTCGPGRPLGTQR